MNRLCNKYKNKLNKLSKDELIEMYIHQIKENKTLTEYIDSINKALPMDLVINYLEAHKESILMDLELIKNDTKTRYSIEKRKQLEPRVTTDY